MKHLVLGLALCLAASNAIAQQGAPDPRIAGPMIQKLQADVALLDTALKAVREDDAKREADLAAWFKNWFGQAEAKVETK